MQLKLRATRTTNQLLRAEVSRNEHWSMHGCYSGRPYCLLLPTSLLLGAADTSILQPHGLANLKHTRITSMNSITVMIVCCLQEPSQGDTVAILSEADNVAAVLPMWQQLQDEERLKLLTIPLQRLQQQAEELDEQRLQSTGKFSCLQSAGNWLLSLSLSSCCIPNQGVIFPAHTQDTPHVFQSTATRILRCT